MQLNGEDATRPPFSCSVSNRRQPHQVALRLYLKGRVEAAVLILSDGCCQPDAGGHIELSAPQILIGTAAQGDGQRDGGMAGAAAARAVADLHGDGHCHPQELLAAFGQLLPSGLTGDAHAHQCEGSLGAVGDVVDAQGLGDAALEGAPDGLVPGHEVAAGCTIGTSTPAVAAAAGAGIVAAHGASAAAVPVAAAPVVATTIAAAAVAAGRPIAPGGAGIAGGGTVAGGAAAGVAAMPMLAAAPPAAAVAGERGAVVHIIRLRYRSFRGIPLPIYAGGEKVCRQQKIRRRGRIERG